MDGQRMVRRFVSVVMFIWFLSGQSMVFAHGDSTKIFMKIAAEGMAISEKLKDMIAVVEISTSSGEKVYTMQMCQKLDETLGARIIGIIEKPYNLKGMTFLVQHIREKKPDYWVYAPKTERARQVAAIDQARFLNMNINIEDMQFLKLIRMDDAMFRILEPVKVDGTQCGVMEKIYDDDARFKKQVLYIGENPVCPVKIDSFDKNNLLVMTSFFRDIRMIQDVPTPGAFELVDHVNGATTVIRVRNIRFNNDLEDTFFRLDDLKTASVRMAKLWRKAKSEE